MAKGRSVQPKPRLLGRRLVLLGAFAASKLGRASRIVERGRDLLPSPSWVSYSSAGIPAAVPSSFSRRTRRDRMRAKLRQIKEQLREHMHEPIPEQGRWLKQMVTGFFAIPCGAHELSSPQCVPALCHRSLAARAPEPQPEGPHCLATDATARGRLAFHNSEFFIPGRTGALPSITQIGPGRFCAKVPGNGHPYRDYR